MPVGDAHIVTSDGVLGRPTAPSSRWSGVIRDAILEGEWQAVSALAYPVQTVTLPNGQPGHQWRLFDWKLMQQLRATISEYGLHSEPARHLITYVFSSEIMTPNDCMSLARLILSPSQYSL